MSDTTNYTTRHTAEITNPLTGAVVTLEADREDALDQLIDQRLADDFPGTDPAVQEPPTRQP